MEAFFSALVCLGIVYAIGDRLVNTTKYLIYIMAAINDLEAANVTANEKLELLQTAVDRVVGAVDPSLQPRIADAAANVNALGNALLDLKGRIDRVVPAP